jgi:hypothetical protein
MKKMKKKILVVNHVKNQEENQEENLSSKSKENPSSKS